MAWTDDRVDVLKKMDRKRIGWRDPQCCDRQGAPFGPVEPRDNNQSHYQKRTSQGKASSDNTHKQTSRIHDRKQSDDAKGDEYPAAQADYQSRPTFAAATFRQ